MCFQFIDNKFLDFIIDTFNLVDQSDSKNIKLIENCCWASSLILINEETSIKTSNKSIVDFVTNLLKYNYNIKDNNDVEQFKINYFIIIFKLSKRLPDIIIPIFIYDKYNSYFLNELTDFSEPKINVKVVIYKIKIIGCIIFSGNENIINLLVTKFNILGSFKNIWNSVLKSYEKHYLNFEIESSMNLTEEGKEIDCWTRYSAQSDNSNYIRFTILWIITNILSQSEASYVNELFKLNFDSILIETLNSHTEKLKKEAICKYYNITNTHKLNNQYKLLYN